MNIPIFLQENNEIVLASQTLEDRLSNVFDQIELYKTENLILGAQADVTVNNYDCCSTYLDISDQIPHWVVMEKEERGGNALTIFDFIQKYYDWLYCDEECGGSDYLLENKLLDIIDIEKTKEKYHKRLYYSYFPEYESDEPLLNYDNAIVTNDSISSFVKNIKSKFYTKKGSIESLKIFFKSIFSLDPAYIVVQYPKKHILRLNAGAFYLDNFAFRGSTHDQNINLEEIENEIVGSYLNHNRFQDGEVFTDYTYILNAIDNSSYKDLYKRTLHPAGLNCIFEFDINLYEPPGTTYIEETAVCEENPLLMRYSPYALNETYVDESFALMLNGGITYYGLTYGVGCSLSDAIGFGSFPCHFFPNWSAGGESYTRFLDIPMSEMFRLCRINNNINPNISIPECA